MNLMDYSKYFATGWATDDDTKIKIRFNVDDSKIPDAYNKIEEAMVGMRDYRNDVLDLAEGSHENRCEVLDNYELSYEQKDLVLDALEFLDSKTRKLIPEPICCWSNPPYTIVKFSDGRKIVSCCHEGDTYDFFTGFLICCVKAVKSSSEWERKFEACKNNASFKRDTREAKKRFRKEAKAREAEALKEEFQFKVQREIERRRIQKEADKRMKEENE